MVKEFSKNFEIVMVRGASSNTDQRQNFRDLAQNTTFSR